MGFDIDIYHDLFEAVTDTNIDKRKLIFLISQQLGGKIGQRSIREVLDAYIEVTGKVLASGGKVHLSGLGALMHKPQAPRHYPHPRLGEKLVQDRSTVRFKLSRGLKQKLNKGS